MFAPWMLYVAAGHFARDLLPAELLPLPTLNRPPPAPNVQAPEPYAPPAPRPQMGFCPLDEGIEEDYERAVWNAWNDPNVPPEQLTGFADALAMEGLAIASTLLRARSIERARLQDALKLHESIMRRATAAAPPPQERIESSQAGRASPAGRPVEREMDGLDEELEALESELAPVPAASVGESGPATSPVASDSQAETAPVSAPPRRGKKPSTRSERLDRSVIVSPSPEVRRAHEVNGAGNGTTMPAPPATGPDDVTVEIGDLS